MALLSIKTINYKSLLVCGNLQKTEAQYIQVSEFSYYSQLMQSKIVQVINLNIGLFICPWV